MKIPNIFNRETQQQFIIINKTQNNEVNDQHINLNDSGIRIS